MRGERGGRNARTLILGFQRSTTVGNLMIIIFHPLICWSVALCHVQNATAFQKVQRIQRFRILQCAWKKMGDVHGFVYIFVYLYIRWWRMSVCNCVCVCVCMCVCACECA